MIISFTNVYMLAAMALVCATLPGLAALIVGSIAIRRESKARIAIEVAAARIAELESVTADSAQKLAELLAERERTAALPTRPSLREAVALSRHGASTEELVNTCRIGQSEARLIQMLYGAPRPVTAERTAEIH